MGCCGTERGDPSAPAAGMLKDILGAGIYLSALTGGTGSGQVQETSLEVADPEDKRLRDAWEALWGGVLLAGGLAVSFGASGMCRQGSLAPGSSHCAALEGCRWKMGLLLWEWKQVCCLPPAHRHLSFWVLPPPVCPRLNVSVRNQLKRDLGGKKHKTGRV